MNAPLLELVDLTVNYPLRGAGFPGRSGRPVVHAVEGVSLTLDPGQIVALVGESGCGKSTVARAIVGLQPATSGQVIFDGTDLTGLRAGALRPYRRAIQLVHQDPYDALDPRMTVRAIVEEGLRIHRVPRGDRDAIVRGALERVGLTPADWVLGRFPHELSGGQRQRVAIASAIALTPRLLVADEPVSMLDVSVRASVLGLIEDLRRDGLAVLLITHDLAGAVTLADRIAVMYFGRIVEEGPVGEVMDFPAHPYTIAGPCGAHRARCDSRRAARCGAPASRVRFRLAVSGDGTPLRRARSAVEGARIGSPGGLRPAGAALGLPGV